MKKKINLDMQRIAGSSRQQVNSWIHTFMRYWKNVKILNMKNITKIVVIMFVFSACVYSRTALIADLGQNFYFIGAGTESLINYQKSDPKVEGLGGFAVIPAEIIEYNFDSVFIISKTDEWFSDTLKYWILDKSKFLNKLDSNGRVDLKLNKSILFQTDDSMTFINELKARKIEMALKPRN